MENITLSVSKEIAEYLKKKEFVELFIRDTKQRCSDILKVVLTSTNETQRETVKKIAEDVAHKLGLSKENTTVFIDELSKIVNSKSVRRMLTKGTRITDRKIQDIARQVSAIYSSLPAIQGIGWLNTSLTAVNIATTVVSTVIICEKLSNMDKKLDRIEKRVNNIEEAFFESQIKSPCRAIIKEYKVAVDELGKGKKYSEKEILATINQCHDILISVYNLRDNFAMPDFLELIYDMLPVFTELVVLYYQYYYNEQDGKYVLHDDWMKIYDLVDSKAFYEMIEDYLIIEDGASNSQVNEIIDCHRLIAIQLRRKIEQTLDDLRKCESAEEYREILSYIEDSVTAQKIMVENELREKLGDEEAQQIIEKAKGQLGSMA